MQQGGVECVDESIIEQCMEIMRDFMKSKIPELVVPNDLSIHKKKIVFLGEDGIVLTLDGFVITSLAWYKVRHFQLKLYKIRRNAENTYLSQMEDTKELKKEDTIFKYVYKIEKKSSEQFKNLENAQQFIKSINIMIE